MRTQRHSILIILCLTIASFYCEAKGGGDPNGVATYVGEYGETITMTRYGKASDKTYLVLFERFNNQWDNLVLLHHLNDTTLINKYEIRTKTGKKYKPISTFQSIVDTSTYTIKNGSLVPIVQVHLKGRRKPINLWRTYKSEKTHDNIIQLFESQKSKVKL